MAILDKDFLAFLKDLSKNNNREWFHANKKRYEASLKKPFAALVDAVIEELNKKEDIPIAAKDAIFRINRDVRFSKDKSPYKTHVAAIISKNGRKDKAYPGYYLHIAQGSMMIGGGAYFLEKEALYSVRQHISLHPTRFAKILKNKDFVTHFETIKGEQNKRIPKEFREAAEKQPLIANKQFYYMAELDPKLCLQEDIIQLIRKHCKAGKVLNDFLIEAIYS